MEKWNINMRKFYKHYKNQEIYEIVNNCKIQERNQWVDAIIYKNISSENLYVRKPVEFFGKFILIEKSLYEIKLESKDNNVYICFIESNDFLEASSKALKIINDLGWEHYKYKIIEYKKIW